jgi:hypothetical protein
MTSYLPLYLFAKYRMSTIKILNWKGEEEEIYKSMFFSDFAVSPEIYVSSLPK